MQKIKQRAAKIINTRMCTMAVQQLLPAGAVHQ